MANLSSIKWCRYTLGYFPTIFWTTFHQATLVVSSVIIFLSQMTLPRWLTFLLGFQAVVLIVLLFWIYLRDVPWESIFKLGASAAAREFCEWVQVEIDVYISLIENITSHSSPWFSTACAAAVAHRNYFFHLHQYDKSSASKVKFRQTSNRCKRVLEAAKLAYANKTRVHYFPETWLSWLLVNC